MGKLKRFLPAAALIGLCALIFSLRLGANIKPGWPRPFTIFQRMETSAQSFAAELAMMMPVYN